MTRPDSFFNLEALASNIETLAATKVLTSDDAPIQSLDPGGAGRTITLPAAANVHARLFFIANTADAAEALDIQNAAAATICTPTQDEVAIVWSDGTNWHGIAGAES